MWRDFETAHYDSDDERLVMDGDVPGSRFCSKMNEVGAKMDSAVQEVLPRFGETATSVKKSAHSAITTAEKVGMILSDAVVDYFGALEENDASVLNGKRGELVRKGSEQGGKEKGASEERGEKGREGRKREGGRRNGKEREQVS